MELWIPYGETEIPIRVPDDNFYKILEPKKPSPQDTSKLIQESLAHPVSDFQLSNISKPGTTAGILLDPILPLEVQNQAMEILKAKLADVGIDKLKLFQRHRSSNVEVRQSEDSTFTTFNPRDTTFTELGKTNQGTRVQIENELLSCDLKIVLGLVTPHFAGGFTGGPDIVLPGSSSLETISSNRSLMIKGLPYPTNINENLILTDELEACKMAGTFYSLSFIPDGSNGIDSVHSGELEAVFQEAVSRYLQVHSHKVDRKCDVVVLAAGKVLGMDLYHGVRVLSSAFGAVKKEGTIILVAECSKGNGNQDFLEYSRRFSDKRELITEMRHKFKLGSHVSLFLQDALEKHRIQLVSVLPDLYARESFKLKPSRTASSAIQQSLRVEGKDAKILIVTKGDLMIPVVEAS